MFNDKEINDFVEQLILANESIWSAMCSSEELQSNRIVKYIANNDSEDIDRLKRKIKDKFVEMAERKNSDTEFAKPENTDGFENFQSLIESLEETN